MVKITKKEVEHVAHLARLSFAEDEKEKLAQQLSSILSYVEKLNELDTKDIEPTSHVLTLQNIFKEEEAKISLMREQVLANAPDKTEEFFKVPRIIE